MSADSEYCIRVTDEKGETYVPAAGMNKSDKELLELFYLLRKENPDWKLEVVTSEEVKGKWNW